MSTRRNSTLYLLSTAFVVRLLVYSLCPSLVNIVTFVSLKSTAEQMLTLKFEVGPLAGFMAGFVLALCALGWGHWGGGCVQYLKYCLRCLLQPSWFWDV